jgi:hypothetical protein
MKNNSYYRPLASQSSSFRLFEDNYDEVMKLCQAGGRKPAEELRELIDEALRARRGATDGQPGARPRESGAPAEGDSELHRTLRQALDQYKAQTQHLTRELREYYGLLLEALGASYGARQLIWRYVAEPRLRQAGCSPEKIAAQFEAEAKAWNAERDSMADMLEQALRNLPPSK